MTAAQTDFGDESATPHVYTRALFDLVKSCFVFFHNANGAHKCMAAMGTPPSSDNESSRVWPLGEHSLSNAPNRMHSTIPQPPMRDIASHCIALPLHFSRRVRWSTVVGVYRAVVLLPTATVNFLCLTQKVCVLFLFFCYISLCTVKFLKKKLARGSRGKDRGRRAVKQQHSVKSASIVSPAQVL